MVKKKGFFEWLGFKIDKAKVIKGLPVPKKLIELRSFFGPLKQNIKLIQTLASLGSPLRPLLNKKPIFLWSSDHTKAFEKIKQETINLMKIRISV